MSEHAPETLLTEWRPEFVVARPIFIGRYGPNFDRCPVHQVEADHFRALLNRHNESAIDEGTREESVMMEAYIEWANPLGNSPSDGYRLDVVEVLETPDAGGRKARRNSFSSHDATIVAVDYAHEFLGRQRASLLDSLGNQKGDQKDDGLDGLDEEDWPQTSFGPPPKF